LTYLCCKRSLFDDKLTGSVLRAAVSGSIKVAANVSPLFLSTRVARTFAV
jgi:hypothetical protein